MTAAKLARALLADALTALADWCARVDERLADACNEPGRDDD